MLTADGHQVTEAFDGKQGVEMAYVQKFDLILMDISFTPDAEMDVISAKAHKTAGSAALFGAMQLNKTLLALENHAKAGDETAVSQMRAEVLTLCQDTRDALTQATLTSPT